MQQPPLAPSSQEEATIPQSATASGETSEEDGLFFEKVFVCSVLLSSFFIDGACGYGIIFVCSDTAARREYGRVHWKCL